MTRTDWAIRRYPVSKADLIKQFTPQYHMNEPIETDTMNTTKVEVTTTERTADDILKALRAGKYITSNGSYIVSSGYKAITVAANPLSGRLGYGNGDSVTSFNFTEDTLQELTSLVNLVTAERKIDNATDTKEWAVESLNIEAKDK